ncbi:hypothetical protein CMK13_05575 [Candidatus Poribacteria bacterium]|nr:hypothetical protein [Candidatus Poribacteria bacterium]
MECINLAKEINKLKHKTMTTMELTTQQKNALKNGETLTLRNSFDGEGDLFTLWLGRWGHFNLEKNAVIVKSTKTLKPILNKLAIDGVLTELTEIN